MHTILKKYFQRTVLGNVDRDYCKKVGCFLTKLFS